MSQPTVAAFFNTRKRVAGDDLAHGKKVLVLDQSVIESHAKQNRIVYCNDKDFLPKNAIADGAAMVTEIPETRRAIRATRSSKRNVASTPKILDHKATKEALTNQPKLVNFLKKGKLSPKKRAHQASSSESPAKAPEEAGQTEPIEGSASMEFSTKNSANNMNRAMKTPTEAAPIMGAPARPVTVGKITQLTLDEMKGKLSRSARLAELKTSLNKLQSGFERLDRMERARLEETTKPKLPPPSPSTSARNLKEFESIELEVPVSPQKPFTSPTKLLHRTPTKAIRNMGEASPQKAAVTPKRLAALMSPIKDSPPRPILASPTKTPAYQRFQTLVEATTSSATGASPALQLPYKYRSLLELFKCTDTVCSMFYNRKEQITFKKLKPAVQRMARKNFYESHLAKFATLLPDAFHLSQELTKNYGSATKHETYQLVIKPNVEEKNRKGEREQTVDSDSDEANVIRSAQNHAMNPQVMTERVQMLHRLLLQREKAAHEKFLLSLDPPMIIPPEKLTRWHPEFDLESCPDIEQAPLPEPPNVERFSSAKDVLSTARNLFNCGTAMERALERLEDKKRQQRELESKLADTCNSSSATGAKPGNETNKAATSATTDPFQSALRNVPQSLLEKIRAKQAAKAMDAMTRRPSQEQEAIRYGRLPEIARHLRNVFVTERRNVLPLETLLVRVENSYRGRLTMPELEQHIRLIAEAAPGWISLPEVRKTLYVKLAKDGDLSSVITALEARANEKLKV